MTKPGLGVMEYLRLEEIHKDHRAQLPKLTLLGALSCARTFHHPFPPDVLSVMTPGVFLQSVSLLWSPDPLLLEEIHPDDIHGMSQTKKKRLGKKKKSLGIVSCEHLNI